jgi:hypothetical protein
MYKISFLCYSTLLLLLYNPATELFSKNKSVEPDTVIIYFKYYITIFSKSKHFPVMVKYWLAKKILDCEQRYKRIKKVQTGSITSSIHRS